MTLYFLSGLGADKRVFKKLILPEKYNIVHIDWIIPQPNESVGHYAQRLSAIIKTNEPFSIIGLSFGGIMANELAKITHPEKVILISSVAASNEIPWYFKPFKYLAVYQLISKNHLKKKNKILYWIMGAHTMKEKVLMHQIAKETDLTFFKWAITQLLNWKQKLPVTNVSRIHGTCDNIFPIKNTIHAHEIHGGGHLTVYAQAHEVSALLTSILQH